MQNLLEESLTKKIAFVAHDAGAANLVIHYFKHYSIRVVPFLQGPALQIWQRHFPGQPIADSLFDCIYGSELLISGTGWASNLEHESRVIANQMSIRTIAVLDHWTNYEQRFVRDGLTQFPEVIWVFDEEARMMATAAFGHIPVHVLPNVYIAQILSKIVPDSGSRRLLFLSEPVGQRWGTTTPGEFLAFEYFYKNLNKLNLEDCEIIVKPHPFDDLAKFDHPMFNQPRIQVHADISLEEAISCSTSVFGIESYAMVIAKMSGRSVYSCIPPNEYSISLPHQNIVQIRNLLS